MASPNTALTIGKGSTALALLGGGGVAANELMTPEAHQIPEKEQEEPIHREVGPYKEWWNDMLKNEKSESNAGLKSYELQPGACSKGFFSEIQSFDKVGEVNKTSANEPYGCVTMNFWSNNETTEGSHQFAAKIETAFVEGNKGLITTTLLMPHDENTNHLKELYLRYELNKDNKSNKWSVSNGYGWVYSRSVSSHISGIDFIGKDWFEQSSTLNIDLSKLCHRKSTTIKSGHEGDSKECGSLEDEKIVSNNFKYVEKKISKSSAGKWSSPFQGYIIKYKKKSNSIGSEHENLGMWSNGDLNSQCVNISYKWSNSSWTKTSNGEQAWISKTGDYFDTNQTQTTTCPPKNN